MSAALGDFVLIAPAADLIAVQVTAFVQAADTVTIQVQNLETADDNTDLASPGINFNGLILSPKKNVLDWATA